MANWLEFRVVVQFDSLSLWEGIHIVDSPHRNPKGCKESSRWSESAETTGKCDINWVAPRRGARTLDVKLFYVDL